MIVYFPFVVVVVVVFKNDCSQNLVLAVIDCLCKNEVEELEVVHRHCHHQTKKVMLHFLLFHLLLLYLQMLG